MTRGYLARGQARNWILMSWIMKLAKDIAVESLRLRIAGRLLFVMVYGCLLCNWFMMLIELLAFGHILKIMSCWRRGICLLVMVYRSLVWCRRIETRCQVAA